MNTTQAIAKINNLHPLVAQALTASDMKPHENPIVTGLIHRALQAHITFARRAEDLADAISKGQSITARLEDLMFAEVDLETSLSLLRPVEYGIAHELGGQEIVDQSTKWALSYTLSSDLPRSSGPVHNARSIMVLESWRKQYRDLAIHAS